MHTIGQVVQATVERVLPFGTFVRMKDSSLAYIRRREMSLTGDISPNQLVSEGEEIQAKIISLASDNRYTELSIRQILPDPWQVFGSEARIGDIVTASVKYIAPDRIFVQIHPGIDGLILLRDLAPWTIERPDKIFWVGDRVQALVTYLDVARKRVHLSVRQRIKQLERVEAVMTHLDQQTETMFTSSEKDSMELCALSSDIEELGRVDLTGEILIIEDHDDVREPLVKWLTDLGCDAQGMYSAQEALTACALRGYSLIIVDLDMPEMSGVSFIQQLRTIGCANHVAVMSDPQLIADNLVLLQTLNIAAVFPKPLDVNEIHQFLLRLAHGEGSALFWEFKQKEELVSTRSFGTLTQLVRSSKPLKDRMEQGLARLVQDTQAELGVVFHLDPTAWKVSITATVGVLDFYDQTQHALTESPIKDVIVEGEIIWENQCSEQPGRFRKLLEFLPFESCIGVPIHTDRQTEYALFLFHRAPRVFSHYRVRDALAMATLFSAILENQTLAAQASALNNVLLSGQLANAFGHEVYNKVSGLDLQLRNLCTEFGLLGKEHTQVNAWQMFQEVRQMLEDVSETAAELQQTTRAFRQLMGIREEMREAQVNAIIKRAVKETGPVARKAQVTVRVNLVEDLPLVLVNHVGLYQVFLNLILNAVQQMELVEGNKRILNISTDVIEKNGGYFIEIRFQDTGPGIHYSLWEKIFTLGFTTRPGGSGLGLYIVRSLLGAMQGLIVVEESWVPLGTTFLITLPVNTEAEHNDK